ncbi:MAG TPA: PAS domain-containing protein, partial [Vicinamibacteria bacterium]
MSASSHETHARFPDSIRADTYRSLVEGSPDGLAVVAGGRIVYANPGLARLLGVPDPRLLAGASLLEMVDPERQEALAERIQ